jgi:hypothetical protein
MRRAKDVPPPYHSYCVLRLDASQEWEVCEGIARRPVFAVREGRLAILLSRLEPGFTARLQHVIEHSSVVHRAFQRHTVLPFRFGTAFESEQQARGVLLANRSDFQEAITRLRGKVEMQVKVLFPGLLLMAGPPEQLARELMRRAPLLEESCSARALPAGAWLVQLAHLVSENRVAEYGRAVERARQTAPECQFLPSGPWPPYHFLPPAIRIPARSEAYLQPGRRIGPASVQAPAAARARAAKA